MRIVDIMKVFTFLCLLCLWCSFRAFAETGRDMWLRYAALEERTAQQYRAVIPASVVVLSGAPQQRSAQQELARGIRGMLGRTLRLESELQNQPSIVLGTIEQIRQRFAINTSLSADGYWLKATTLNGTRYIIVAGA